MAKFNLGNIVQGALGNLNEQTLEELNKEYKPYLFEGEKIESGFKLIRDAIVFTNYRIIFVDRQGATGKKTSYKSIYLMNIVDVEMESAGFGLDDSEITITYLENVKRKAHTEVLLTRKFEFPKNSDIIPLYRTLGNLAYKNRLAINEEE